MKENNVLAGAFAGRAQQQYMQQIAQTQQAAQALAGQNSPNSAAARRTKLASLAAFGQEKVFLPLGLCAFLAAAVLAGRPTVYCIKCMIAALPACPCECIE